MIVGTENISDIFSVFLDGITRYAANGLSLELDV